MTDVAHTMKQLGGLATWAELRRTHSKRAIRQARDDGRLVRLARRRYAVPSVAEAPREAHRRSATLSHLSAALAHGWKVKQPPALPTITVRRKRHVTAADRATAQYFFADLRAEDVADGRTVPLRTVLDCARTLPFNEALAVADSALRSRRVDRAELRAAAAAARGPGATGIRRVAEHADGRAANPLESVLRAIAVDIPDLVVVPQCEIAEPGLYAIADLADVHHRLVLEAEGYEFHGTRRAWRSDARRFTSLAAYLWTVLRFTYEDLMYRPEEVRWTIEAWLAHRRGAPTPPQPVPINRQRSVSSGDQRAA
ncbi:MAG: DUF559 domain-containing protein [Nostocoides sp.]